MTAGRVVERLAAEDIHTVRVLFADQHGLLRGKAIAADAVPAAFERGVGVPGSLLHKDTGNNYAIGLWAATGDETLDRLVGARNIVMKPDPSTFRPLPWADGTGVVLSDLETTDGQPIPHATRRIAADAIDRLGDDGLAYKAGLELEFHLFRVGDDGELTHSHPGWDLLGDGTLDLLEPAVRPIREGLVAMGLEPISVEAELGPSQVEMTFAPSLGLAVADEALLVRAAITQLARRHGHRASFMSRPILPGVGLGGAGPSVEAAGFPSGWHLHQSLVAANEPDRPSVFAAPSRGALAGEALSPLGASFVAGLLEHAAASCLLTTPTVNGYKRYRPHKIAPDRISWSPEHRGAMLRVVGNPGDPDTRIENRVGDPAANPYLYVASQVTSGLDGVERNLTPPEPTETPYEATGGDLLPRSLGDAIDAFVASSMYRKAMGDTIVDYLVELKRSEWNRFLATVTDWEQREYFGLF
jgi:glutamine synthetase